MASGHVRDVFGGVLHSDGRDIVLNMFPLCL